MFVKPIKLSLILTKQEENHMNMAKSKNPQWDFLTANKQLPHALLSAVGTLPTQMHYHPFQKAVIVLKTMVACHLKLYEFGVLF